MPEPMRARAAGDQLAAAYCSDVRYSDASIERLLRLAANSLCPDATVLDVGAGTGVPTLLARRLMPTARLVAVDLSEGMLRGARDRSAASAYVVAEGATLPFGDGVADVVMTVSALHLLGAHDQTLAEFARVLRRGGKCLIVTVLAENLIHQVLHQMMARFHEFDYNRHPSRASLLQAASASRLILSREAQVVHEYTFPDASALYRFASAAPFFGMRLMNPGDFERDISELNVALLNEPDRQYTQRALLTGLLFAKASR